MRSDMNKGKNNLREPVKNSVMKFRKLGLLILLTVVTSGCVVAVAEDNDSNTGNKKVLSTLGQRMQKRISVDFRDTPIEDVIRIMAEQSGVDIIKSPKVTGNVTATLTNVPLDEALNNILVSHGYGYIASNNMIRIAPLEELSEASERLVSRIYRITYANVAEVEKALNKFISKRGSLSSSPGTSDIIVTDNESKIKAIDTFMEEIDRITPQILVEVRIYDVTATEGFDIGAEWYAGRNTPVTNLTHTNELKKVNTLTNTVDTVTPANTGKIDKTVTTDTDTVTKDNPKSWREDATTGAPLAYRKSKPFVGGSFSADTGGTISLGLLDTVDIDIALNVLRTQVGAKLLANPRILVLDNETAEFEIISEIPYTEQSQSSTGGSTMTSTQFKKVGTKLKVTPHVTREGMIRLQIVPEFGVVSVKGTTLASGLQTVPTVDTRKVDTKALVKDGQTVVLGGLRKRTVTQDISKIPLLGDIPLLGKLFMSNTEEEVKTNELVIFITPRIVVEPTLSAGELKGLAATEFSGPKVTYTGDEKSGKSEK